ncbi:TBC1 domain family member 19 [Scaptodrosophila lebanonensis]|uniref:TBC1 domain family member 19 n=1 Tax=Drosophila lebanonensis TaxID=7225 RepID=A0A6J2U6Z8_DROLE|nr:TBC1 domain family member 19 [Scaptodrosophila lebanonensis]
MEELQDASIHHSTAKVIAAIKNIKRYEPIYKELQRLVCTPNVDKNEMRATLETAIKTAGLETEIRNIIFNLVRTRLGKPQDKASAATTKQKSTQSDPVGYLKRAGVMWDRRVRKSLNAMCAELKVPLHGQPRISADREDFVAKWNELSSYNMDLANYRPVYAPKDLLDVFLSLKGPAKSGENTDQIPKWEFSHIALPVKNLFELRTHFADLLRSDNYMGVSDPKVQCQRILEAKHAPLCQQFLKKGCTPAPYRGALWASVLDTKLHDYDIEYWQKLRNAVWTTDHIVDKLVFKDIQLTASNDDQYFVFEDVLYQVMLCFSRDTEVANCVEYESFPVKGRIYEGPPSGVVPFHGICMFAAPFCYLYDSPMNLYFTFRAFYIRYCHRLTTINTHPQGIISLCLLFEKLLQTYEPELWSHFRELQIQPLRLVFKWLMRAFSGHLPPKQLLVLWDLILGFDSLEILSLFSIIILSFRKESIMQVNSLDSIEAILADLSSIKVLPLVQMALSRD